MSFPAVPLPSVAVARLVDWASPTRPRKARRISAP